MTNVQTLRLVSSRAAPTSSRPVSGSGRYRVNVERRSDHAPEISVTDKSSGRVILGWRGRVAQKLLDMASLQCEARDRSGFDCDKHLLKRLAIAGAAASRASDVGDDGPEPAPREPGPRAVNIPDAQTASCWSSLHGIVAGLLRQFPRQHLAEEDIVCLLQFRLPCISRRQVRTALSDLADWNHVQRIRVPTGAVHYDLDTRPHLHVFDAKTQQLRDAPQSGVLQIETS